MLALRRLRLLSELARRGTIAEVARLVGYTPSAISQSLLQLEREAGVPLLERDGRRVRLTPAAHGLVARTDRVLAELDAAEAELAADHGAVRGAVAAERLAIPHASVAGNACAAVDSPAIDYFPGNRLMLAEPLARHREQFGLPPDPEVRMPFRHLHMCFTPPAWDGTSAPRPPNTRFLRHASTLAPGARLPDWVERLPDRPTVLASLGTVFNNTPGVLEAIVRALAEEPVNVIVAIGRDVDPARFGPHPDHVRLEAYVPQALLLPRCAAFITHGGFNSVKEALSEGVPMVVVPISADQPYSAER